LLMNPAGRTWATKLQGKAGDQRSQDSIRLISTAV
jgi:hypothetical protein